MQKKKEKKKHLGGRPTKFTEQLKIKAEKLSRRGFTDKEIGEILDVSDRSIRRWKVKHPEFCPALKMWKAEADENVERSLYERACGYSHVETKAQWVNGFGEDENGNPIGGRWETIDLIKHYPPDSTSAIFWLKNRLPDEWRDIKAVELSGKDGKAIRVDFDDEKRAILKAAAQEVALLEMELAKKKKHGGNS